MKKILAMMLSVLVLSGCGLFTGKIPASELEESNDYPLGTTVEETTATTKVATETIVETTVITEATTETAIEETTVITEATTETTFEETTVTTETTTEIPAETTVTTEATTIIEEQEEATDNAFNAAFLKAAIEGKDNIVISPLSLKFALNMAATGAGDGSATQSEMLALFGYEDIEKLKAESEQLAGELNRKDGSITLNNSYWVSDIAKKLNEDYVKTTEEVFSAEGFTADLTSESFVNDLNGWIEEKTNGMIKNMLGEPLQESARLVLVNTLYFKNEWLYKFYPWNTRKQEFYGNNGTETVEMMRRSMVDFEYGEGERLRSIAMPYRDGSVMNVYIPKNDDEQLGDILAEMSSAELERELNISREMNMVNVVIPKFECDYKESLVDILKTLGLNDAFDSEQADFSGISEEPLYISQIIQAAKIICDEEGTEASAATLEAMAAGCAEIIEQPIDFNVDRPFMYEIKSPSGETLFMGVIQSFKE